MFTREEISPLVIINHATLGCVVLNSSKTECILNFRSIFAIIFLFTEINILSLVNVNY